MFEDQVANELRVKLHNDGGSGGLLGRDGKCVGNGGVDVGGVGGGDVSTLFCSVDDGQDDFFEYDARNVGGGRG